MSQINPSQKPPEHGDRRLDCEFALDMSLRVLIDDALNAGWEPNEVFAALQNLVEHQRKAYGEDPDPADDPNWITAESYG